MPDSSGNLLPTDPGYVAPTQSGTGLLNSTTGTTQTTSATPAVSTSPDATAVPPVAQATASTAAANPFTVAPNQTVASNIANIVSADSPLMQQAQSRAMQQMNARGLLNSTEAISAGQSAVYDAALPIAQQDATTYNQNAMATTTAQNTANLQNAQLATGISQSNAAAVNAQTLQQIQSNTTLSVADKQAQTQMAVTQANNQTQVQLQNLQSDTSLSITDKQTAMQKSIADANNFTQTALAQVQADTSLSVADKQTVSAQIIAANNNATSLAVAQVNANSSLANIDANGAIQTQIAHITASNNALIQTSQSAASLYTNVLGTISDIARDPNVVDKQGAIQNQISALNDGLGLIGDIQGLNLSSTLNFTAGGTVVTAPATASTPDTRSASGLNGLLNQVTNHVLQVPGANPTPTAASQQPYEPGPGF